MRLREYMNENNDTAVDSEYYNESFCNIVFDYLSSFGSFSEDDIQYLREHDYDETDFEDLDLED